MIRLHRRKWIILAVSVFIAADVLITLSLWPAIRPSALSDVEEKQSSESLLITETSEGLPETTEATEATETADVTEESATEPFETADEIPVVATPTPRPTQEPDPLELAYHQYEDIPQDQALSLFAEIDSVSDLIISRSRCENISFYSIPRVYGLLVFRGLSEKYGVNEYWYCDNFETSQLELRLCANNNSREYSLLATKPLPAGYTEVDAYDKLTRVSRPSTCLSQALLDQILAAGNVYPIVTQDFPNGSCNPIYSDDGQVLTFLYYMPETRQCINIYEDYNTRELYYCLYQVPNLDRVYDVPSDQRVPLSPEADINDYAP